MINSHVCIQYEKDSHQTKACFSMKDKEHDVALARKRIIKKRYVKLQIVSSFHLSKTLKTLCPSLFSCRVLSFGTLRLLTLIENLDYCIKHILVLKKFDSSQRIFSKYHFHKFN